MRSRIIVEPPANQHHERPLAQGAPKKRLLTNNKRRTNHQVRRRFPTTVTAAASLGHPHHPQHTIISIEPKSLHGERRQLIYNLVGAGGMDNGGYLARVATCSTEHTLKRGRIREIILIINMVDRGLCNRSSRVFVSLTLTRFDSSSSSSTVSLRISRIPSLIGDDGDYIPNVHRVQQL